MLEEPHCGGLTIVRARGVGVLGREAVVDAHERQVELFAEDLVKQVGHLRRPRREPAAVDVQEHGVDLVGHEGTDTHPPGRPGDLAVDGHLGPQHAIVVRRTVLRDPFRYREGGVVCLQRERRDERVGFLTQLWTQGLELVVPEGHAARR